MLYLTAAKEILKEFPEVKFHLLGEGTLVNEINSFISANKLEKNINFKFHKNPPGIFAETSVLVSLQTGTNYPSQSVLEAMGCGNAVIASNTGDTDLFINNSNGMLVELNTESLVSALKKLIKDPLLAKQMGLAGKELAEKNHTIEKASAYYLELFEKAYKKVFNA
jgi:glycosyltransferase involved in cell wall biosynthesis